MANYVGVSLGNSMFMDWGQIDAVLDKWAKEYFGKFALACGNRDEDTFEISLSGTGLHEGDYEKYVRIFEAFDDVKDYEPEDENCFLKYGVTLPAEITKRLMVDILGDNGLKSYGTALATYDGVFFMEFDRFGQKEQARIVEVASWSEMQSKYLMDRDEMTEEEEEAFVADCFRLYEQEGFSPLYWSPFTDNAERIGLPIDIVGRIEEDSSHDLSVLPMWKAMLNGEEFEVFPEEVIPSEMKANGCNWFKEVLEYDSSIAERVTGLPVDVMSPQEMADLTGKAVKDGNKYYLPKDIVSNLETIIFDAAARIGLDGEKNGQHHELEK